MDLSKELLKGNIDTIILSLLADKDMYGYELAKVAREKSNNLFDLKEGTLYLSLKRLEHNGSIGSYWGDEQGPGGRRKYYSITQNGKAVFESKIQEWKLITSIMETFLKGAN